MDKIKPILLPVLLFALVIGLAHWHGLTMVRTDRETLRANLDILCAQKAEALEGVLSRLLSATGMLGTMLRQGTLDRDDFDAAAAAAGTAFPGVEGMGFALEGVPEAFSHRMGIKRGGMDGLWGEPGHGAGSDGVLREPNAMLSGPFKLFTGQIGFMGRFPVIKEYGGQQRFWGFVTAVTTLDTAEKLAGLKPLAELGYVYSIEAQADLPGNWDVLAGGAMPDGEIAVRSLQLKGVQLRLLLGRADAMAGPGGYWASYVAAVVFALALSGLFHLLLRQPARLGALVSSRTAKLREVIKRLAGEIRRRRQTSRKFDASQELSRNMFENNPAASPSGNGGLQDLSELMRGLAGMRVLIVDDNPLGRYTARELLGHAELVTAVAESGPLAVEAIRREQFDVVLLDLNMPGMDGFETLKAIRELPGGGDLPVIALTGRASGEDRIRSLTAGMDDHLTKPLDAASLYAALRLFAHRRNAAPEPASMDSQRALILLMGNKELYARLLKGFVREYGTSGERMGELIAAGAAEDAAILAHSIKGLAANLGGERLSKASLELETALRAADLIRIPAALKLFEHAVSEFSQLAERTVEEVTG